MTPSPAIYSSDEEARARIRTSLDESLIVEAAAGTGKTSELVRRIVSVLESGRTTVDRIAAVTFTHKAAGELKLRLRQELDKRRSEASGDDAQRNLEHALARLEEATIGTIHSFCAQILRERPVEARVDPAFVEMPETESDRIFNRAFRGWIQEKLNQSAPGLRRALIRLAWRDNRDSTPPLDQLKFAGRALIEWRDHPAQWEHAHFDRENEIDHLVGTVQNAAATMSRAIRPVHDFAEWIERAGAERIDRDTLEALLLKLQREMRQIKRRGIEQLQQTLENFRRDADADLAWHLREEMSDLVDRYEEAKRQAGQLDFLDLLILARDLVRDNVEVRAYLQQRYTHLFVDEFQDTDPLQAELILLLAAGDAEESDWLHVKPVPGKLFVVGDPKQSIYKFRRADVVLYQTLREKLEALGVGIAYLRKSFRSVPAIQQCVNSAFAGEMTGDRVTGQAHYVPLEPHTEATETQPAVVVLPPPKPYGMRNVSKTAIDACLPETVAAWLDWLLNQSGWTIRDPEGGEGRIAIAPRHICILFRRFTNFGVDITREYTRHLESRSIPHLLVGSRSFHSREEVETMRAALTAIEWPDDELSLYATLRGSLFAIPDAPLLKFRHRFGRMHPFQPREDETSSDYAPVWQALEAMANLHRRRNHRPVVETVNMLLEATRAHAGFALRPAGHQVLANVRRISDLARSYEMEGGISFRGFVEYLEGQARKADSAEAPVLEEGAEGIRLMTVHAAKGLEFPVVVLADMTANIQSWEPQRFVDAERGICAQRLLGCTPWELLQHRDIEAGRERAEGVRVAYVAATRAKDLLAIPAVGDEERSGWLEPLNKSIYPAFDRRRMPDRAPGCPTFGQTTVLERPSDLLSGEDLSVKPGLHVPRTGEHSVVWWDPGALVLGLESSFGIRQKEILGEGSGDSVAQWRHWREERARLNTDGSRERFHVFTPSETGAGPDGFECEVIVASAGRAEGRPTGARFGSLVHAVLRDVHLAAGSGEVVSLAQLHGRLLGATDAEIEAAWDAVQTSLRHPVLRAAAQATQCRREWPMLLRSGNQLIEGVIDLAYESGGVWTVVDYKTDEDFEARLPHYEVQLKWYAHAVALLTGQPASACLLRV